MRKNKSEQAVINNEVIVIYRSLLSEDLLSFKGEYEPNLNECLNYTGQRKSLRKLGLKLFGAEQIAILTDSDLADEIQKYYAVVENNDEEVTLVERSKIQEYNNLVTVISR